MIVAAFVASAETDIVLTVVVESERDEQLVDVIDSIVDDD